MPGTGKLYIDQIPASTVVENYAGNDIKPSGSVFGLSAKINLGDGSANVNSTNYVDAMSLEYSDFPGLSVTGNQITIDPDYAGIYQCCFQVAVNGGSARANAGFQWVIDGSVQSEMYLSNYNRNDAARDGGTHNTSSDGGCQIFNVANTVRIRGSRQGNTGTITTISGSLTLMLIAPAT
jgi:hypothetical protein